MTRQWFPEAHYMPDGQNGYYPLHRFYLEAPFKMLPGPRKAYPTVSQALQAAKRYLIDAQRPIRSERSSEPLKPANDLGREEWLREKRAEPAREQQKVLGALIVRGKEIPVEKRRIA